VRRIARVLLLAGTVVDFVGDLRAPRRGLKRILSNPQATSGVIRPFGAPVQSLRGDEDVVTTDLDFARP